MRTAAILLFIFLPSVALGQPEIGSEKEKFLLFPTYISMIKNSIGARSYRNVYFLDKGRKVDVLQNGVFSCAYFTSSILYHFGLIENMKISVEDMVIDMKKRGWVRIEKPRAGSVIVWNKSRNGHLHTGFFIRKNMAVSTSSKLGIPVIHNINFDKSRKIIEILWHPKLELDFPEQMK